MPRFPIAFNKRKSTADTLDNAQVAGPSFRVLDRSEKGTGGKSAGFDGGARLAARNSHLAPRTSVIPDTLGLDDNIFADLKNNRGSGSSNTTKTTSTDNSSRHSNASTAPSSADMNTTHQEDWRNNVKKSSYDHIPLPPVPKDRSSGFLKAAGRSFSFGGKNKSSQPATLVEEPSQTEPMPPLPSHDDYNGRPRATTSSTVSTAMPPKVDQDFTLDLGGDFSRMLLGGDKRQSVATLRDEPSRQAAPRSLTGARSGQPSPLHLDKTSKIEQSPFSWNSRHLLTASPINSPVGNVPPPVPRHGSPLADRSRNTAPPLDKKQKKNSGFFGRKSATPEEADVEEEDARLLKESLSSVNKFLAGNTASDSHNTGRYRRNEEVPSTGYRQVSSESRVSRLDKMDDDNMFSSSLAHSGRLAQRYVARKPSPPRNKVMTPAQFERYRQDKERQGSNSEATKPEVKKDEEDDDEDNYEDDDDEVEKSKQAAKQRRKQEAHMTVYRQQMMKVTGEQSSHPTFRPHIPMSMSSPNLGAGGLGYNGPSPTGGSDPSDEDEEVPLAILAAHGFPGKNRPPTRLSTMMSNPNLQAAATPSYQRPMSVAGDAPTNNGGRLPAFAKNLPKDPYLGAGLIHQAPRESFTLGGGAPASASGGVPPGGLVGVIASEERSRAMRRGSPAVDAHRPLPNMNGLPQQLDPMGGIPPHMLYPSMPAQQMPGMMAPPDQTQQMQMNAQMQQFMQMQMQFMQMMAASGQGNQQLPGGQKQANQPMGMPGMMGPGAMGMGMPAGMGMGNPDMMRHSVVDNGSMMDLPMPGRPDHTRTMSLVQPSSASWIQPAPMPLGYAPSIRIQGINGGAYAPSIAPSERSNIGLPGRYRPVSQMPTTPGAVMDPQPHVRKSLTMSGALGAAGWDQKRKSSPKSPISQLGGGVVAGGQQQQKKVPEEDEDDERAWEAMREKREKKKGLWKSKGNKGFGADLAALIS